MDIKKIYWFRKGIINWSKSNMKEYPWRKNDLNSYEIIVSEVLLQRTKAEKIKKFFPYFINKYTDWISILNSTTIIEDIGSIGLQNQKTKRLKDLAREIIKRENVIPDKYDELIKIPQVGQYIAYATLCLVHDKKYPLLDVNMVRVLERVFGQRKKSDFRYDPYIQELSRKIVYSRYHKIINWSIIDFAHQVCKPNPLCSQCIFRKKCLYFNLFE